MERRLLDLQALGIQADIIAFHPYDRPEWGFANMGPEADEAWVRYIGARFSAYRNVWWTMANEYDLFNGGHESPKDWDRMLQTMAASDPFDHLLGIHNGGRWYDHSQPWITHVIIQDGSGMAGRSCLRARRFNKPIIVDEYGYEEVVRRHLEIAIADAYASHGETYVRRYVNRAYPVLDVRAYSNAESATLTVNGVEIGETPCPDRICVWRNVRLAAGENVVRAQARIGNRRLRDEVLWTAPDANDGLRIDSGELTGHEGPVGRFGSDNFFEGGTPVQLSAVAQNFAPVAQTHAASTREIVDGHADMTLFNAYRQGDFSYALPVPDGTWRIRLITFEPDPDAAATRTFNVFANGQAMLVNFSPAQEAGGALRAVDREFVVTAADGDGVNLTFQSVGGPAVAAAIVVSR